MIAKGLVTGLREKEYDPVDVVLVPEMGPGIQCHTKWRLGQEGPNRSHLCSFDEMYPLSQANAGTTQLCQSIIDQTTEPAYLNHLLLFSDAVLLEFLRLGSCTANRWSETEVRRSTGLSKRLLVQLLAKARAREVIASPPSQRTTPPGDCPTLLSPH